MIKNFAAVTALILLTACNTTTPVNLAYIPHAGVAGQYTPMAAVGEVKDSRQSTATNLGGGLELQKPAAEVVRNAVNAGMKSRNMLKTSHPKYLVNIDIIKLDSSRYVNRGAHAEWNVTMVDKASKKTIFTKTITVDKEDGSMFDMNNLKDLSNQVLEEAVDKLLGDQGFTSKFN